MEQPRVSIITKQDRVIVQGTLPHVTVKDVKVTPESIILIGEHHGHQFVQELPLETTVDAENALVVFQDNTLTVIMPRGTIT